MKGYHYKDGQAIEAPGRGIHIYLPVHIVDWLDKQKESRSSIIKTALQKHINSQIKKAAKK
jgi:hypothetical protein